MASTDGTDARSSRRLLAISAVPVNPGLDGYALRVRGLLSELAKRWSIVLLAPADGAGAARPAPRLPDGIERRTFPQGIAPGPVFPPPTDVASRLRAFVRELVEETRPGAALLWSGTEFLALGEPCLPPAVADRIDSGALTVWRGLRSTGLRRMPGALSTLATAIRHERAMVRRIPATVVVGEDDARWLRRLGGRASVHVVPNGVLVEEPPALAEEHAAPTVTFTGVLCYRPNVEASLRLAGEIWPSIAAAVPGARLVIAGREPLPEVLALGYRPGVEIHADVPDLRSVLVQAWVCVAPMWSGAGIKNKVLEAWALAKPVVLSPMAANGLALDAATAPYVAGDVARFAERVVTLLRSAEERRKVGLASREIALRHHGWPGAADRIETLLERAMAAPAAG